MRYAYIGTVETLAKANEIASKYHGVVISGVDEKGNYELSVASENDRRISALQRRVAANRI
jgi:hypothetical protein